MAQPAAILSILVTANTNQAVRGIARVQTQLGATQGASNKALGAIKTFAKGAAIGTGIGLGYAIKKAADFEQQLDSLGSVSGATGRQMEQFRKQAMAAGAATKFSALDAAAAQTELAKGGLKVQQIMKGGLNAALALAAAGEMDLAEAAATTANALNLFGLEGKSSMKVADALAKAANATTADVSDFAMALRQSGGVAKTAGLSFSETVLALEALANAGTKNSDAGTSLKTALIQLIKPTKKQAELADELNLKFLDAQGNFKGLADISEMLRGKLGGMTAAQRTATLATLAGTDGVRTLTALYDAGPAKLEKWKVGLDKSGTAAQVAAQKQDNLKGKLENLQGSIETIAISIGSKMLPTLTAAAEKVTDILNDPKLTASEKFDKLAKMMGDAVSAAIPVVAKAAGKAGLATVRAFFNGFRESDLLAKLVIGGVLFSKMGGFGAFRNVGTQAGGAMAEGTATTFAGRMKGRMRGIGKGALGGLLLAGVADAMTSTEVKGIGDRLKLGLSTATLGIVPPPQTISENLKKNVEQALRGGDPGQYGWDKFWDTIGSGGEEEFAVVDKLKRIREEALAVFGGRAQLSLKIQANPDQALADMKKVRSGMVQLRQHASGTFSDVAKISQTNLRLMATYMDLESMRGHKAVQKNMRLTKGSILDAMQDGRASAKQGMSAIEKAFVTHSQASHRATRRNFDLATDALKSALRSGLISAEQYTSAIARLMRAYLAEFGIKGRAADIYLNVKPGKGKPLNYATGGMVAAQGGVTVPGHGSGDKVHMQAMVEPGEKVFVLNRNASAKLNELQTLNSAVPRFATGGYITRGVVGGPPSNYRSGVQASGDRVRDAANERIAKAAEEAAKAAASVAGGGTKGPKGIGTYAGMPMANWVIEALQYAARKGVAPAPTSGYRSHAENVAHGRNYYSEHEGTQYPHGAVDFGGYTSGLASKLAVVAATADFKYPLLSPIGFEDDGHASGTGHRMGGLLASAAAGKLSYKQIAELLKKTGMADIMGWVAWNESDFNPRAYNSSGASGLWQMMMPLHAGIVHGDVFDPLVNAKAAASLYKGSGNSPLPHWVESQNKGAHGGWASKVGVKFPHSGADAVRDDRERFRKQLEHVKRPKNRLLDKVKGVGLPRLLERKIGKLTEQSDKYAEFADRASQLTIEGDGDSQILGMVEGKNEIEWLTLELEKLFKLRNALIRAHDLIVAYRERLTGAIEVAQGKVAKIDKALAKKGLSTDARRKLLLDRRGQKKLIEGLTGRRKKVNTARGDILGSEGLEDVQGAFAPMKALGALPAVGVLGGRIFDTQIRLRDLGEKPSVTDTRDSESADLLRELNRTLAQKLAVSQAQYPEFLRDLPTFHTGGVVQGYPGQERMAVVQAGEGVFTPDQMGAMGGVQVTNVINGDIVNVPAGKKPLETYVNGREFDAAVRGARFRSTPLPGRGGG